MYYNNCLETGGEKFYENQRKIKTVKMSIKSYYTRNNRFFKIKVVLKDKWKEFY